MIATFPRAVCPRGVVLRVTVVVLLGLLARAASAQPITDAGLAWQAPTACPSSDEVRARIERRLGEPLEGMVHGIEVAIAQSGSTYIARVDARGITMANDIRTLTSASCDELTDAVAVIVARLANEVLEKRRDFEATPQVVASEPEPSRHARWGGGVRALALSSVGALPKVSVGGELAGYVRHDSVFVELAETWWGNSFVQVHDGAPGGVGVGLTVTALRVGWVPSERPLRAWVSGEYGTMDGMGFSLTDAQAGTSRWTAVGAGFGVAWPMAPHARLVGTIEAMASLAQTQFVLDDGTSVYHPGIVTARCALGLEVGWR